MRSGWGPNPATPIPVPERLFFGTGRRFNRGYSQSCRMPRRVRLPGHRCWCGDSAHDGRGGSQGRRWFSVSAAGNPQEAQHVSHGIMLTMFSCPARRRNAGLCARSWCPADRWRNRTRSSGNEQARLQSSFAVTSMKSRRLSIPCETHLRTRAAVSGPPGRRSAIPMQACLLVEMIVTAGGQGFFVAVRVAERHAGTGLDGPNTGQRAVELLAEALFQRRRGVRRRRHA